MESPRFFHGYLRMVNIGKQRIAPATSLAFLIFSSEVITYFFIRSPLRLVAKQNKFPKILGYACFTVSPEIFFQLLDLFLPSEIDQGPKKFIFPPPTP